MDFQKMVMFLSFISILGVATTTVALADESMIIQAISNSELNDELSTLVPQGHIEEISWVKRVSNEGVIEIRGITFSIVNEDTSPHSFETCAIIEGPFGKFTSNPNDSLSCTTSEIIEGDSTVSNQFIDFSKGVKVSNMINISITIQQM